MPPSVLGPIDVDPVGVIARHHQGIGGNQQNMEYASTSSAETPLPPWRGERRVGESTRDWEAESRPVADHPSSNLTLEKTKQSGMERQEGQGRRERGGGGASQPRGVSPKAAGRRGDGGGSGGRLRALYSAPHAGGRERRSSSPPVGSRSPSLPSNGRGPGVTVSKGPHASSATDSGHRKGASSSKCQAFDVDNPAQVRK